MPIYETLSEKESVMDTRARILVCAMSAGMALGIVHAQQDGKGAGSGATGSQSTQAAPSGSKQTKQQQHGVLASRLVGMGVRDGQGKDLGEIQDLAIDVKSGHVRYALVEFEPEYLSGERTVLLPLKELHLSRNGNSLVYEKAQKDKLQSVAIKPSDWNGGFLRNQERLAKLDQAWGLPPQSAGSLMRANTLLDKEVQNRAGEDIGEIEDLVINMDQQKVQYAMLEFERSWLKPEKTVATPFSAFTRQASGDKLVMNADREKLKQLQGLTAEQRRNPNDPQVVAIIERHIVFLDPDKTNSGTAAGTQPNTKASGASRSPDKK